MVLGSVVFAASLGGTRGAVFSVVIASLYLVYSGLQGVAWPDLREDAMQLIAGVSVLALMGLVLGRLQDRILRFGEASRQTAASRNHSLFREAPEAIAILDVDTGSMVEGNPYAFRMFEMTPEEFRGTRLADLCPEHQPDGRRSEEAARDYIDRALRDGVAEFEWWHKSSSGREFPCEITLSRLPDKERNLVRGALRDISARKQEESQREGEHRVLESIAAGEPLEEALAVLAASMEEMLPGSICTVLLLNEDRETVRHGALPSLSSDFAEAIDGARIGPEAGSCGTAMYRNEPVITEDIRQDPKWDPWRPVAEAEGLRACWSLPIHDSRGQVTGSFALYYREPRTPSEEDLAMVERMRSLAGIAIERARNEEELRHREALYRATFEEAAVGIAHVAPDGRYMRVNARFCDLVGYTEQELQQMRFQDLTHPDEVERDAQQVESMLSGDRDTYYVEKRYVRKDGDTVWVNLSASAVRTEDGAVERFVVVVEDISAARKLSEELSYQARHDALTGLVNRTEFEYRLRQFIEDVLEGRAKGAVCYLDLDQFKLVNDTAGHVAGDEMLRQLAPELQRCIRDSDTLARLGGDEFGVLLKGCDTNGAVIVANKMRHAVEEFPFVWGDKTFKLGVSIGVVPLAGDSLRSVTEILKAADAVCYTAKDSGRNKTVVWREDDASIYRRHGEMQWVPRLNKAIENELFTLLAQPIVPVSKGSADTAWYELLLRLNDDGRIIEPGAFLPAAERYGLAPKLDRLVTTTALTWLSERSKEGKAVRLSVNLSGASLGERRFRKFLMGALEEAGEMARNLCFEITETAAITNLTEAVRLIDCIREFGCLIALDDFGSGLSSFAYLKNLPVDFLKIDGVFVRDVASDPIDRSIARSIHEVGRVMGKKTIAEFVESEAIMKVLHDIGVDYAQGYWIGEPRPLASLEEGDMKASVARAQFD